MISIYPGINDLNFQNDWTHTIFIHEHPHMLFLKKYRCHLCRLIHEGQFWKYITLSWIQLNILPFAAHVSN